MSRVVLVHGIGQQLKGPRTLSPKRWVRNRGMEAAASSSAWSLPGGPISATPSGGDEPVGIDTLGRPNALAITVRRSVARRHASFSAAGASRT